MAYTKNTPWVNGDATRPLDQTRLNHIEDGLFTAAATADNAAADALAAQGTANAAQVAALLDDDTAALVVDTGTATGAALSATFAGVEQANTFTETQNFDEVEGFGIGDVILSFVDGFFGQRLHLTGKVSGVMPYLEVVPTSTVSTDTGKRLAGVQIYKTVGGGGVPDREFLAIESVANAGAVPGFTIASWASGTGTFRPLRITIGAETALTFQTDDSIVVGVNKRLYFENTNMQNPLLLTKQTSASHLKALEARQYGSSTEHPRTWMSRNRGTIEAPTWPVDLDILGEWQFGAQDQGAPTTARFGASFQVHARNNWSETARATRITINGVQEGEVVKNVFAQLQGPSSSLDTALLLRVNRGGVRTLDQVTIGPADSGGTGYRLLRVAN